MRPGIYHPKSPARFSLDSVRLPWMATDGERGEAVLAVGEALPVEVTLSSFGVGGTEVSRRYGQCTTYPAERQRDRRTRPRAEEAVPARKSRRRRRRDPGGRDIHPARLVPGAGPGH